MLLSEYFEKKLTRTDIQNLMQDNISFDTQYTSDNELLKNCEWALRYIDEPDYWTTDGELNYYLQCLKKQRVFSVDDRNSSIAS